MMGVLITDTVQNFQKKYCCLLFYDIYVIMLMMLIMLLMLMMLMMAVTVA